MNRSQFAVGSIQKQRVAGGCRRPAAIGCSFIVHPSSLILMVALMVALPGQAAQVLTDPTQPPAALAVEAPAVAGVMSPTQQLQSVIISPKRKAAIINGVLVELGGKYGDAVLTKVAEDEVVLSSNGSHEVLKLYPAVEKVSSARSKRAPSKSPAKAPPQPGSAPRFGQEPPGRQP